MHVGPAFDADPPVLACRSLQVDVAGDVINLV
jgi:hypothetical protein